MRTIKRAIEIALLRPLHVIRYNEIKLAIAIVVHPGSAGGKFVRTQHTSRRRDVFKRPLAVVMKEVALAKSRDEDVVKAVVVIVADGCAESEERHSKTGPAGDVRESTVMIVVIKLGRSRAALRVSDPILAIDKQYVRPTVIVVVDESAARAHRFRQPLLSEGAVVVCESDSRLRSDVDECNGLRRRNRCPRKNQYQPQKCGGTEEDKGKELEGLSVSPCFHSRFFCRRAHHRPAPKPTLRTEVTARGLRARVDAPDCSVPGSATDTCS